MHKFDKNKQEVVKQAIETLMCQRHPGNYPTVTFDENDIIHIKSCCRQHETALMEDLPNKIQSYIRDWASTEFIRCQFED